MKLPTGLFFFFFFVQDLNKKTQGNALKLSPLNSPLCLLLYQSSGGGLFGFSLTTHACPFHAIPGNPPVHNVMKCKEAIHICSQV